MRARFDENKNKDVAEGMRLLASGQKELFENKHFQPRNCKCEHLVRLVSSNTFIYSC